MSTSIIIPYFEEIAAAVMASPLGVVAQELTVLAVFLLSYVLWRYLGRVSQKQRVAKKLKEVSPTEGRRISVRTAPEVKARKRDEDRDVIAAAEAQMLAHMDQREFTRALNIFRGLERDGKTRGFREDLYLAFIQSAARVGKTDVVDRMFNTMKRNDMVPSVSFWQKVLKMLSSRKHPSACIAAHDVFGTQLPTDKVVMSCLINAALTLGDAQRAANLLELYSTTDVDLSEHVLFFRTYLALKDVDAAEALFRKLGRDTTTLMFNHLLLTCANSQQQDRALALIREAHQLEEGLPKGIVDTVSYNTVIRGFSRSGDVAQCFNCLREISAHNLRPDDVTFATILDACIEGDSMDKAAEIVMLSQEGPRQHMSVVMYTLLIKGMIKLYRVPKALELYEEMKKAGLGPDVITYSVLIKALVDSHDLDRAVQLMEDMKKGGHKPDDIILTHLLEGCRHKGNLALGNKLFEEIVGAGSRPSEFSLVTLLKLHGRVGAHRDSREILVSWEQKFGYKPSVIHYTCVMSGCLRTKDYDLAWSVYDLMRSHGVHADAMTLSTLMPGMVAAQRWERVLAIAKVGLTSRQHRMPAESLNNALAQMQLAQGQERRAAELRDLMQAAGVPMAPRRSPTSQRSANASWRQAS